MNLASIYLKRGKNLLLNFLSFFSRRTKCQHDKITPHSIWNYCPDCGKEISIRWFILRCNSCSAKRESKLYLNTLLPVDKHCSKCGCSDYYVERKEKVEFFDLNFAVMAKEEINDNYKSGRITQIWVESENCWQEFVLPKLIPLLSK
jgi:hypothetical protein